MKKIIIPISTILVLALSACKKYTDLTPKGSLLVETAQDFYNLVSLPNRGYYDINFRYISDNMWLKESSVLGVTKNNDIVNFTFDTSENRVNLISSSNFYSQAYLYINRWNTIISLAGNSKGDDELKARAVGEAKVLRAFDYFHLINVYAKAYDANTAATDGGVCIMDKYDLEASPTKGTVQQCYDLIQKDLDEAIPYIQTNPVDVYHPNLAFAWALKAKVHLFKREIAQAKEAALKSLSYKSDLFDMVDLAAKGGPNVVQITAGNNPEVLSYQYMSGYNEMNFVTTYTISPELRTLFGTNDARFNLFFNTTSTSVLDQGAGTAYWSMTYSKFFYPTVGMKTPETYLILAECYAREDDYVNAMKYLNALRVKRIVSGTVQLPIPATRKEAMNYIIDERRKELWIGFHRFFDLKRLNLEPDYAKTLTRTFPIVNTAFPKKTYTLAPNSRLYIIPFPANVLKINKSLTLNTDEVIPF